jgi:hypothetical protein
MKLRQALMAVKIFLCYAHEDEDLLNKLKAHLRPLEREGLIEVWHDRDISAGTEWEQQISKHLKEAQIILLLVSSDFMASDYCYSVEMKYALERHERGEAQVIPIILRPVLWEQAPFGRLQALPKSANRVVTAYWFTIDHAWLDVAEGIRNVAEDINKSSYETQSQQNSIVKTSTEIEIVSSNSSAANTPVPRQAMKPPQNYPQNQTFVANNQSELKQQQQVIQSQVSSSPSQKSVKVIGLKPYQYFVFIGIGAVILELIIEYFLSPFNGTSLVILLAIHLIIAFIVGYIAGLIFVKHRIGFFGGYYFRYNIKLILLL